MQTEKTTTRVPPRINLGGGVGGRGKKKRVAIYARVSVGNEDTEMSLTSQMKGFSKLINEDPTMVLAGVYADEGITGTSARKRKQFLQMMKDAEGDRFDTVMTKSISRFARNTVTCLESVRKLKARGINVVFVKEGIDTANSMSEMLLTVLAAFAQNESFTISENLKWGIRKRYERGEARWTATYGYRTENKTVVIVPEEAEVVRKIYELYRTGIALPAITQGLNTLGIASPRGKKWTETTVLNILRSERYVGDILLQKYISVDHISHKCVLNDGSKVPSYYVRGNHAPIVDRRTHEQVQRIMELKAPRGECSRYPYEDAPIICPFCGKKLTTRLMHVQKEKKALACFAEDGCHGFAVKTWMMDEVLRCAFEEVRIEDVVGSGEAAKRMREMKAAGTPETIEYYFLADLIKRITFIPYEGTRMQKHKKGPATEEKTCDWDVVIEWQCGLTSTVPLPADERYTEEPTHVAELYERYLERMRTGEYIPARPKNLREKQMKEEQRIVTKIGKENTRKEAHNDHTED